MSIHAIYYDTIHIITSYPYLKALFFPFFSVLLIWFLEWVFIGRKIQENFLSKEKTFYTELILWLSHYTPVASILSSVSCFGIFNLIKFLLRKYPFDLFQNVGLNYKIVIYLTVVDFSGYLAHFILHKVEGFWNFHQFHHSAQEFNVLTVNRVHFFEKSFIKLTQTSTLILLGGGIEVFWWWYMFSTFLGHLKHSNFRFNYPGILKYIIQSPAHHWIHHSDNPNHYDTNYGEILQIWDTIFGTGLNPKQKEILEINIGTNYTKNYADNFLHLFFSPYKKIFKKNIE